MQPYIPWSSGVYVFFIEIIHSLKCTVPFSFVVPLLSLVAICCTRCHSLYYSLSLFLISCITRCHLLSLVVPLVVTHWHSLSLVLPLVVTRCHSLSLVATRCTTRLPFYKRSTKACPHYFQRKKTKRKCKKTFKFELGIF